MAKAEEGARPSKLLLRHAYLTKFRWWWLDRVEQMARQALEPTMAKFTVVRSESVGAPWVPRWRGSLACGEAPDTVEIPPVLVAKVSPEIAREALKLTRRARRARDPRVMDELDEQVRRYELALFGIEDALRKLEEARAASQKGANTVNQQKPQKYADRKVVLRERFLELQRQQLALKRVEPRADSGLDVMFVASSERTARAEAVKQLAGEFNVTVKRMRDIVREL